MPWCQGDNPVRSVARAGVQQLEYRQRAGIAAVLPNRVDNVHAYGGGVGYRLGRDLRIGFNVDRQRRDSDVVLRQYNGLRYGVAVTYGT